MGEGVDSRGGGQGSQWGQQWAGAPYAEPRSLTAQDSREPGRMSAPRRRAREETNPLGAVPQGLESSWCQPTVSELSAVSGIGLDRVELDWTGVQTLRPHGLIPGSVPSGSSSQRRARKRGGGGGWACCAP